MAKKRVVEDGKITSFSLTQKMRDAAEKAAAVASVGKGPAAGMIAKALFYDCLNAEILEGRSLTSKEMKEKTGFDAQTCSFIAAIVQLSGAADTRQAILYGALGGQARSKNRGKIVSVQPEISPELQGALDDLDEEAMLDAYM